MSLESAAKEACEDVIRRIPLKDRQEAFNACEIMEESGTSLDNSLRLVDQSLDPLFIRSFLDQVEFTGMEKSRALEICGLYEGSMWKANEQCVEAVEAASSAVREGTTQRFIERLKAPKAG